MTNATYGHKTVQANDFNCYICDGPILLEDKTYVELGFDPHSPLRMHDDECWDTFIAVVFTANDHIRQLTKKVLVQ